MSVSTSSHNSGIEPTPQEKSTCGTCVYGIYHKRDRVFVCIRTYRATKRLSHLTGCRYHISDVNERIPVQLELDIKAYDNGQLS